MEIVEKYGLLVFAWLAFGFLHSLLSSKTIKLRLGLSDLSYRRLFNLQSLVLLLAILFYGGTIEPTYFLEDAKANKAIGLMCATFGYLLLKLAFKEMSVAAFLGFKKEESTQLITTGIYARVRHPLYTATILIMMGFLIFSPSYANIVHSICVLSYVIIGALFEERRLERLFGNAYTSYKKNVPFLIPSFRNGR
jgi:protein-S-isoprenylcysteine O-methyltransferase Ste14